MVRRLRNFTAALVLGIALSYTSAEAAESKAMVTTANLNVRSGAGTGYSIVGSFPKDTTISVQSISNGWAKISYNGQTAYCSAAYLKEAQQTKMVTTTSLNVRSGAGTSYAIVGLLAPNTSVTVISVNNNWAKILYNNEIRYCSADYLKKTTGTTEDSAHGSYTAMVTTTVLNARTGPGTSYSVAKVLPANTEVKVIGIANGWAKINQNGQVLYCSSAYLKDVKAPVPEEYKIMEATTYLNVRSGPATSYSKLGMLNPNDKVKVVSASNGWAKILYQEKVAYCSASYLKEILSSTPETKKYIILTSSAYLNVRNGKNVSCDKIGMLSPGEEVKVVTITDGWAEIIYKGQIAYCSASYLKGYEEVVVTADELNVRSSASTSAAILGKLPKGTVVARLGIESNGWSRIIYNGQEAYCSSNYLALMKEDNNSNATKYYYKDLDISFDSFLSAQANKSNVSYDGEAVTRELLDSCINPSKLTDSNNIYQFLKIDKFRGSVDVNAVNSFLNSLGEDNVFYNQGQAFVDAAREYDIDVLYLIAHTMLETGYGTSALSKGVIYQADTPVKVYNFFGIGAYDDDPLGGGSKTAYQNGWTTVEAALKGGVKWISENYVHSKRTNQRQYTVYMMRWNTNGFVDENNNCIWHQYATDVKWAKSVSSLMNKLSYIYTNADLDLEIPNFK